MNIESFRNEVESDKEWRLRRKFIENNKNKYPVDRLICLSMCYINHVSYGVTYPAGVMKLVKHLSEGLPRHIDVVKESTFIGFVKSDDNALPTTKSAEASTCYSNFVKANDLTNNNNDSVKAKRKYSNFVQSTETEKLKPLLSPEPATKYPRLANSASAPESDSGPPVTNKYLNIVKFEKESGNGNNSNTTSTKQPKSSSNNVKTKGRQQNISVNAEASNETTTNDTESAKNLLTNLEMKFYSLSHNLRSIKKALPSANSIQVIHVAADKTKMTIKCDITPCFASAATLFICKICINDTHIVSGTGPNKRAAKHEAYNKAIEVLSMSCLKINTLDNGQNVLVGSSSPQPIVSLLSQSEAAKSSTKSRVTKRNQNASQNAGNKPMQKQPINDWIEFLIMSNTMVNATAILRRSAIFNKMPIEYVYRPAVNGTCCRILLNEESIMECVAESKFKAKTAVSKKALDWLQERCWTIHIKQTADSDDVSLSRDELMNEIQKKQPQAIPSDNVGNQLLRKMGWVGGGIGAEGNKGIEDPITVDQVIDRQGLGCRSGVSAQFDSSIHDVLVNYVKSKNQNDLVFATNFSKQERAIMHKEARKLNLKSVSRGTGASRYLVISRKRNPCQLFNHIMESGGSTMKYELIPPKKLLEK
ncbi:NF-kappa-B-repressing factor-like [Octopus vulgaris]|uniref:NF-kappa-B-repressing factor-like n=2 Tax=Octopus TaxID=6643 RepID=A0AA36EWZ4_OCTVU|nr:uncharacterized protein LOC115216311 [Octopus sinensis]CAI9716137.1 NF-kappa-B-repressing factor-like [Octopus vulgaris]